MNILFLDQFGTPGGAQQCLRDLVPAVIARGWTAHFGLPQEGILASELAAMGAVEHSLHLERYTNGRKSFSDGLRFAREIPRLKETIRRIVRQNGIDIVYVNGPRLLPAVALATDKIVFHSHSLLGPKYARLLTGTSLRRSQGKLIAASQFVARPLEQYVAPGRRRVVYNGVRDLAGSGKTPTPLVDTRRSEIRLTCFQQPTEPRPSGSGTAPVRWSPSANGRWKIGIIGRIAPEKNQCDFVRAARTLLELLPDCRFVICGEPLHSGSRYEEQVRALAKGLPIEFLGWQSDIGPVLRGLDVVALPSTGVEATPRVIPEAFSAGVPVVAYNSGGIPELLDNGVNGLLTDEPSPESLAWSIRALLAKPEQMQQLSRAARRTYDVRFTLERFRQDVLSMLDVNVPCPTKAR